MVREKIERISPWLYSMGSARAGSPRLFCFPYAGGSAYMYRPWTAYAGDELDLYGVELPGRGDRFGEPAFGSLRQLIPVLADHLTPALGSNFAFFGHSMGALIIFELTRELVKRGLPPPLCLFVSGRPAPHLSRRRSPRHMLSDTAIIAELRELGGTPVEVLENAELLNLVLPMLRADFAVCETYVCPEEAPLKIPIQVFAGADDTETNQEELDGWSRHTRDFRGISKYPGGHFFLHAHAAELVCAARAELCRSR